MDAHAEPAPPRRRRIPPWLRGGSALVLAVVAAFVGAVAGADAPSSMHSGGVGPSLRIDDLGNRIEVGPWPDSPQLPPSFAGQTWGFWSTARQDARPLVHPARLRRVAFTGYEIRGRALTAVEHESVRRQIADRLAADGDPDRAAALRRGAVQFHSPIPGARRRWAAALVCTALALVLAGMGFLEPDRDPRRPPPPPSSRPARRAIACVLVIGLASSLGPERSVRAPAVGSWRLGVVTYPGGTRLVEGNHVFPPGPGGVGVQGNTSVGSIEFHFNARRPALGPLAPVAEHRSARASGGLNGAVMTPAQLAALWPTLHGAFFIDDPLLKAAATSGPVTTSRVLWDGVAMNLVQLAALAGLVYFGRAAWREKIAAGRAARGLCPGCGYPRQEGAGVCPECGADSTVA